MSEEPEDEETTEINTAKAVNIEIQGDVTVNIYVTDKETLKELLDGDKE